MPVRTNAGTHESFPGVQHTMYVDPDMGSGAITVGKVVIAPGAEIPPHSHPVEDGMVILAGRGQFHAAGDVHEVTAGSSCLAPANVVHGVRNTGDCDLVLVFAWPAVNVKRDMAETAVD